MILFNNKLEMLNTIMIIIIIVFLLTCFITNYFKSIENFNTYGYVACPPQFSKVEGTNNIYYSEGNIGIGTDSVTDKLNVLGNTNLDGNLRVKGLVESDAAETVLSHTVLRVEGTEWGGRPDGRTGSYLAFDRVAIPKKCFVIITNNNIAATAMFYVGVGEMTTIIENKRVGHLHHAYGQHFRTYAEWPHVGNIITQLYIRTL